MNRFWANIEGQVAILFALALPVLAACLGLAVDYTSWVGQERKLQGAADAAAVAAARELYLANASQAQIVSVAETTAHAQFLNGGGSGDGLSVAVSVDAQHGAVHVSVSQPRHAYFAGLFSASYADLESSALARAAGGGRICVIGLDPDASGTIQLNNSSTLTAPDCSVYSNSTSRYGVEVDSRAELHSELVCSAGGYEGDSINFQPEEPLTDCPQIADPLENRAAPNIGTCDYEYLEITSHRLQGTVSGPLHSSSGHHTLYPGTYCGGLSITHGSVTLQPGTYIISGGPLLLEANSRMTGENVTIYLHGDDAVLKTVSDSAMDLSAPETGEMAGILFFEDRNAPLDREHVIKSNEAGNLLGTIYFPRGRFVIDTNARVADRSAYTAIVARALILKRRPNLFLNADYDATDVPVPEGVGPVGGNIVIER